MNPEIHRLRKLIEDSSEAIIRTLHHLPEHNSMEDSIHRNKFPEAKPTEKKLRELRQRINAYFAAYDLD
jgi:ABC-type arginine transport system ATPase subunit